MYLCVGQDRRRSHQGRYSPRVVRVEVVAAQLSAPRGPESPTRFISGHAISDQPQPHGIRCTRRELALLSRIAHQCPNRRSKRSTLMKISLLPPSCCPILPISPADSCINDTGHLLINTMTETGRFRRTTLGLMNHIRRGGAGQTPPSTDFTYGKSNPRFAQGMSGSPYSVAVMIRYSRH